MKVMVHFPSPLWTTSSTTESKNGNTTVIQVENYDPLSHNIAGNACDTPSSSTPDGVGNIIPTCTSPAIVHEENDALQDHPTCPTVTGKDNILNPNSSECHDGHQNCA